MPVRQIMLSEKVFAVIIPVGRAHDDMNVLARGQFRVGRKASQIGGPLMIELNQDHRAVDTVVVHTRGIRATDPGEISAVDLLLNLIHLYSGVTVIHVASVQLN